MGFYPGTAKVCVEMDVSLAKPPKIHVRLGSKDVWLPCTYEDHPLYCSQCKRFGHLLSHCRRKGPVVVVGHQGAGNSIPQIQEWKMVTRKRPKPSLVVSPKSPPFSKTLSQQPIINSHQQLYSKNPGTPGTSTSSLASCPQFFSQPCMPLLHPIVEDTSDVESPLHKPTLYRALPPSPLQTLTPPLPPPPFPPDLSFLYPSNHNSCQEIIPFIHPLSPQPILGSKDDSFLPITSDPSWEPEEFDNEDPESISPLGYHSEGDQPTPQQTPISPMEMDLSLCSKVSMPLQKSGFEKASHGLTGYATRSKTRKRWIFWNNDYLVLTSYQDENQITHCHFTLTASQSPIIITSVYGAHSIADRRELWSNLQNYSKLNHQWIIGGDFNTIASLTEFKGKCIPSSQGMEEFSECISNCNLITLEPQGGLFTWSGTQSQGRTWRRLDRILANISLLAYYDDVSLKHLSKFNSDHKPLLVHCSKSTPTGPKPFRFLNAWTLHDTFHSMVQKTWGNLPTIGGMRGLANKLSSLKAALKTWNKETFGDIFSQLQQAEDKALETEKDFEINPSQENREIMQKANAALIYATNLEVQYWKQKANIRWLEKGDSNSKLFQAYVKGKRRKLSISHIIKPNGAGTSNPSEIKTEAISFFENSFKQCQHPSFDPILPLIPLILTSDDNLRICAIPSMDEVKQAVWELDGNSASGPDGFNGNFFKATWETIRQDVLTASQEFFMGQPIPRAYGSTFLTLIPKTDNPKRFEDYRPISLSTFMSKINTKLLANRLNKILPKLISKEQAAFQKGKSIDDHILMAQEAVHLLDKKIQHMEKAIGISRGKLPFTYLGAPICRGILRKEHCKDILGHFEKRIHSWYSKTLNQMGRLILIKHVLSSIPLHILVVHTLPKSIIHTLTKYMANFLWGQKEGAQKYHWIRWNKLTKPEKEGGLGIKSLEDQHQVYTLKLWWKAKNDVGIWGPFVRAKYMKTGIIKEKITDSPTWKRICRTNVLADSHTSVVGEDMLWNGGTFNLKEAYKVVQDSGPNLLSCKYIWHISNTPKIRIFLWKLLNDGLPFPQNICKFACHLPSLCLLCQNNNDDMDHSLLQCPTASHVWNKLAIMANGPRVKKDTTLRQHLLAWWFGSNTKHFKDYEEGKGAITGDRDRDGGEKKARAGKRKLVDIKAPYGSLKTRSTPHVLMKAIQRMNVVQRAEVERIGFGSVLRLDIWELPSRLGLWVVSNYDARSSCLKLPDSTKMHITAEDVNTVLGWPVGGERVQNNKRNKDKSLLNEWRLKFDTTGIKITPNDVVEKMLECTEGGEWFVRHFVMLIVSVLVDSTSHGYVNALVMDNLRDVGRVPRLDWCQYVLDKLIENKLKWEKKKKQLFSGPLLFLLVFYVDRVSDFSRTVPRTYPVVLAWSGKELRKRENSEVTEGGFGSGHDDGRMSREARIQLNGDMNEREQD
ncbi:unnamed protein product [Cuscuta campestris]|uniref:Reverse transcriptase domain-containing protein n=1 Tax=Cuscuta campestris TaxID=132261 RepID=A0A484N7F0_9ASTE|nr:unnamed protein product [Cuscuta campestris]